MEAHLQPNFHKTSGLMKLGHLSVKDKIWTFFFRKYTVVNAVPKYWIKTHYSPTPQICIYK